MECEISLGAIRDSLVDQVQRAANGGSEQDVVTLITESMWALFCASVGMHGPPTDWVGKGTRRVCGSFTVIIPGNEIKAIIFRP